MNPDLQTTVIQISRREIDYIKTILAEGNRNLETLSSMRKRTGVDIIVNGGLYWINVEKIAHSLNLLIAKGKQNNEGVYSRFGLRTFKDKSYEFDWHKWSPELEGTTGGSPSLVIDKKLCIDGGGVNLTSREPRTAVGMDDNFFYIVTVDGRRPSQELNGSTMNELGNIMLTLGCHDAICLDGGGTTRVEDSTGPLNNPLEDRVNHNAIGIKLKDSN